MTDHDSDLTDDMRALFAAGASDVVDYDYEGGLAAHLAAIGAVPAPGGTPPAAGAPAAGAAAGGGAAALGAGNAPAAFATAGAASKAWIALLALPVTGAVAVALWLGGAFEKNEPGATPEATTAASAALASAPGSLNPTTNVVAEAPVPAGTPPATESDRAAREGTHASRRPAPKAVPTRSRSGLLAAEPYTSEQASADFPSEATGAAPSTVDAPAVRAEGSPAPAGPTAEQRFDEELERRKRAAAIQEKQADRLRLEMDALAEAKRALATDPSRAFTIARDGERQFGRSVLSEERQHVLILALLKLGRHADARRVAAPYLQRHPDSPFAKRVQKALDAAGAR